LSQLPHDEFLELCALSTTGELTGGERKRLQEHLAACPSCSEAMKQYEVVVSKAIPALALDQGGESDPSWSQGQAEAALFRRLTLEEELGTDRGKAKRDPTSKDLGRVPLSASQATWHNIWTLCAAGILLLIALGISTFQVGTHRGVNTAVIAPLARQNNLVAREQQVSDAGHEREVSHAQMAQRDRIIADLRHRLSQQSAGINSMKLS
jgi:Putative zinc-finger